MKKKERLNWEEGIVYKKECEGRYYYSERLGKGRKKRKKEEKIWMRERGQNT